MKKFLCTLFMMVALLSVSTTSSAQFIKWGVKAGLNLTNPSAKDLGATLKGSTGWFAGPMAEVTIPLIGLGVDGSLLYSQANSKIEFQGKDETVKQHYIEIPINLKYSIGMGSLASLFVAAGPQFGFNVSGNTIEEAVDKVTGSQEITKDGDNKNFQASINLGLGVKLLSKLQVYGGYNWGLGNSFTVKNAFNSVVGKSKNNMWKVSVAYMF